MVEIEEEVEVNDEEVQEVSGVARRSSEKSSGNCWEQEVGEVDWCGSEREDQSKKDKDAQD